MNSLLIYPERFLFWVDINSSCFRPTVQHETFSGSCRISYITWRYLLKSTCTAESLNRAAVLTDRPEEAVFSLSRVQSTAATRSFFTVNAFDHQIYLAPGEVKFVGGKTSRSFHILSFFNVFSCRAHGSRSCRGRETPSRAKKTDRDTDDASLTRVGAASENEHLSSFYELLLEVSMITGEGRFMTRGVG